MKHKKQKPKAHYKIIALFVSFVAVAMLGLWAEWAVSSLAPLPAGAEVPRKATSTPAKEPTMQEWVINEIRKAGLNEFEAWTIINCESRWNDQNYNLDNKDGSADFGLWMLNSYWQIEKKKISPTCAFNYQCATKEAIKIRLADGNWHQWVCAKLNGIK